MGQANDTDRDDINVKFYLQRRPELHERQVIEIKDMFDSLNPEEGEINVADI